MIISTLLSRFKAYLRFRRNIEILSRLTDRELSDIGVSRGEIENVARRVTA
jgi:uncharacterized protein YjiS (DUF1127 family)